MINWPPSLVTEIARRRVVVFLGAGISMQCRNATGQSPKSWKELLLAAVIQVPGPAARQNEIRKLISAGDFLTACEVIREKMGVHTFNSFLIEELLTPNFQPAPIHDTLIQLGARIYATPNFDKLLENKASALPGTPVRVKNYYDNDVAAVARGSITIILKVHGTIDTPDNMIFTRADYTRARNDYSGFYSVLEALSITHTFLFIGCGLNDPDIKLILENHAFIHKWSEPHYFVTAKSTIPASIIPAIERNLNIKMLEYTGGHTQLKPELDALVSAVTNERANMQMNASW
jgi:hypothetical protein